MDGGIWFFSLDIAFNDFSIWEHLNLRWFSQVKVLSTITPKNFMSLVRSMMLFSILISFWYGGNFCRGRWKIMNLVFLVLRDSLLTWNHIFILSRQELVLWRSVFKSESKINKFVSSAKRTILELVLSGRSLTYIRNNNGPRMEPWVRYPWFYQLEWRRTINEFYLLISIF